ncbi:hypothetical protein [Arenimonas sp.]|uniref:hypothetical protein n=1 Tax=Arenimonas sp. TaxID=1872635 RepID=UPI0039E4FC64
MNAKLFALACLLVAGTANAGYQQRPQVVVSTANRTAQGSLIGARRSPDFMQRIGCYFVEFEPSFSIAVCEATDAQGNTVSCQTQSPKLIAIAQTVQPGSWLFFSANASGYCNYIQVTQFSFTIE